jgi:hypothetical protein
MNRQSRLRLDGWRPENRRLIEERDILGEAAACFAQRGTKRSSNS